MRLLSERIFEGSSLGVVGNINRDVKIAPIPPDDRLFRDGETSVSSIVETIGGGGANSAFAAASLGARVAFLGKVGADELGRRLERTLKQHGIAAHVTRDKAQASGTSVALSFDNGHRHFISCLPANRALSFADLDLNVLTGCAHLLRADVWFSEPMLFEGNKALFETARKMGLPISIDLNWDPHWNSGAAETIRARKQAVRAVLPWVDIAHGNARELMEFADAQDLETALQRVVQWGAEAIVVHLGGRGAGCYQQGSWVVEPPAPITRPMHATGTGDVLSVCMMLLHGHRDVTMVDRLRLANAIVAQFIDGEREMIPPLAD
jgi:sugar/nucleoside kinase (ribokinase family)